MHIHLTTRESVLSIESPVSDPTVTQQLGDTEPECIAVHPDAQDRIFCGTFSDGLYRSIDGGESFERVGGDTIDPNEDPETSERRGAEGGISVMSIAIDPSDPDHVWVGTEPSALFRSHDGGDSWEPVTGIEELPSRNEWAFPPRPYTHHVRCLKIDPTDADRVYVGIEAGAFLLTDNGGETWIERPAGSRRDNHNLAIHPDAPGRVYSAAGDGYAESADHGNSWSTYHDGLEHRYVWGLAVDPTDPDRAMVSSAHGAGKAHGHANAESYVYRKSGSEWERVDALETGEGVLRYTLTANHDGSFIAASNTGIYLSDDYGESWKRLRIEWDEKGGVRDAIVTE